MVLDENPFLCRLGLVQSAHIFYVTVPGKRPLVPQIMIFLYRRF